ASVGAGVKHKLSIAKAEAVNDAGHPVKVTPTTLKVSVQTTVSLGTFDTPPPVVSGLKCGSGPEHRSGWLLGEEDVELEDEEAEGVKLLSSLGSTVLLDVVLQNKVKLAAAADFDDAEAEEKVPGRKSLGDTPVQNAQKSNQNGKDSKPPIPRSKTPKGSSSIEDIKAKMQASEKMILFGKAKVEAKFVNDVNCLQTTDWEAI
ncbi:LOW QUALITY PROTEIN: Nucleophosmin, partial [Galemys pyrenaicus]